MPVKERFLSQFSSGVLPHIHEFSRELTRSKADVVMLMARKAACFVDCLEKLGLTSLSGFVTTDRVLDADTTWLRGKHVLIVDEALITGTTLYTTQRRLLESGAAGIDFQVLCINDEFHSKDLVEYNKPCLRLSDLQTTSLCAEIVDAISLLPLPYAVDFPQLRKLRIPVGDLDVLTNLQDWEVHDISSSLQASHGILILTLIPTKPVLEQLHETLGWRPQPDNHIFKVRLYGSLVDAKRKIYKFLVMPVAVFDPLSKPQIDTIWHNITGTYPIGQRLDAFSSPKSKIRLLQYVVAARVGRFFVNAISESVTTNIETHQDARMMGYLFPPDAIPFVTELCQSDRPLFTSRLQIHSEELPVSSYQESPPSMNDPNPWRLQTSLTRPFLDFFEKKEKKARELALKYGRRVFEVQEHKEIMNRLNTGISLPELRAIPQKLARTVDVGTAISLYIDFAVDRGVIVPIVAEKDGIFFRAFRHGEDIKFSESEARLFCIALKSFLESSNRSAAPHLTTEKLFVLIIRIGIHLGFLTRWNGTIGEPGSLGIRYALKGAVAQTEARKLYEYNADKNLTSILLDSGYIAERVGKDGKKRKGETGYFVQSIPNAPVKEGSESEAEIIGAILAEALFPTAGGGKLSQSDLVLIASCTTPNDTAGALAAEINIFVHFRWRIKTIITRALECGSTGDSLRTLAGELRSPKTLYFEAISSGEWKFRSFMEGAPEAIIKRVAKELSNRSSAAMWNRFWPSTPQGNAFPSDLKALIKRQGSWCFRANIFVRLLEGALLQKAELVDGLDNDSPDILTILREETRVFIDRLAMIDPTAARQLADEFRRIKVDSRFAETKQYDDLFKYVESQIHALTSEASVILDTVDVMVPEFGRPQSFIAFEHAMYVTFPNFARNRKLRYKVNRLIEGVGVQAKKETRKAARLAQVPFAQAGVKDGIWIGSAGESGRLWLIKLARRLFDETGPMTDLRILLISNLPDDWQLRRSQNDSQFLGRHFWSLGRALTAHQMLQMSGPVFFTAIPTGGNLEATVETSILSELDSIDPIQEKHLNITDPGYLRLTLKRYLNNKRTDLMNKKRADVGIITVIPKETNAVIKSLQSDRAGYLRKSGRKSGAVFYEGNIPRAGGNYRIACTQSLDQGNQPIMAAYQRMIDEYCPSLIVLLGIAGGINSEAKLGDVVFASQIFYYEKRSETETGAKRKAEAYRIPAILKSLINDFLVSLEAETAESDRLFPKFAVHQGPLGTGEAVIKFRDEEVRKYLETINAKTLALETEAGGFAQSFYEGELSKEERPIAYLIVRGISDHADEKKDNKWQAIASENAMSALCKLLYNISELPGENLFSKPIANDLV